MVAGNRGDRGANASVDLWDARTGRHLRSLGTHRAGVCEVAFAPGGAGRALSVSGDGALRVWDTESGRLLRTVWLGAGRSAPAATAFSGDRRVFVTGGEDGVLRAYDVGAVLAGPGAMSGGAAGGRRA